MKAALFAERAPNLALVVETAIGIFRKRCQNLS